MPHGSYLLTTAILTASIGGGVFCVADRGMGRSYRLHAHRPGAELNARAHRDNGRVTWRSDLPSGAAHVVAPVESAAPLIMVRVSGPIEQRAGYHDVCGGWSDGHDAICERLCAAFAEGDVLLVCDSPGGAVAGIEQNVTRALAAKARHGRRVTVFGDEMVGSAMTWWAMALGDELFGPPQSQWGSIGARGGHLSIAGAMAKDGLVMTYFADPPDKIAFAPELPLSPVGEARGNRDVKIAADAFRAAVCASPLGMRRGLTPEFLKLLGADMLTGQAAVDAGLADGIASMEQVTTYALALTGSGNGGSMSTQAAEPDKEPEDPNGDDEQTAGARPTPDCKSCGMGNADNAKFCNQCGASMAAKPMEGDEPPPPSMPAPKPGEPPAPAPAAFARTDSLAKILGAGGSSDIAIKTAAVQMRQVFDHAAKLTSSRASGDIIGGLSALADDAAKGAKYREDLRAAQVRANADERMSILRKLTAANVHEPGEVFAHDDRGNVTGPAKLWGPGPEGRTLANLRGYATVKLASAPAARRSPFEPSTDAAKRASADARPSNRNDREIAARLGVDPERVARSRAALLGASQESNQ